MKFIRLIIQLSFFLLVSNSTFSISLVDNLNDLFIRQYHLSDSELSTNDYTANISGTVSTCKNSTFPLIIFTGVGGIAPYTFTYKINGGVDQNITTTSGSSVSVAAPTNITGEFVYSLVEVIDNTGKIISSNEKATVTISDLPVIDFTFLNNECSSSIVQFNSTVGSGNYTYNWNFGDGTAESSFANPTHLFVANNGNGTQSFIVKLVVTDLTTNCSTTVSKTITLKQSPDVTLNSTGVKEVIDGVTIFRTCGSGNATLLFTNPSSTISSNTFYTIDWGDGSAKFETSTFGSSISHTYDIGLWNLTYTIKGDNGCVNTQIYQIFVGSNPSVSLGNPGNTDICISNELTFPIANTENNPVGTIYTVTFNDGSSPIVFNHPPPPDVKHVFLKNSCGTTSTNGPTTYPNSFYANIVASNPCGKSSGNVVPIYVSTLPTANFILPAKTTCTNTAVCLVDSTVGGATVNSTGCKYPKIVWKISPMTGVTLSSGSLGNDFGIKNYTVWTTGTQTVCPKFSIPGNYTITQLIGSHCGNDSITKTICVEPPIDPQFTLSTNEGCIPLNVVATNTSVVNNPCNAPIYNWQVLYSSGYCGTSSDYTYLGGTTASSANPNFQFNNPGTYTIRLSVTNSCGTKSITKTIIVKKPPTVLINVIPDICGAGTINPTAIVAGCAPTGSVLEYAWSFPDGIPSTANTLNPGSISYTNVGPHTVSLTVKNECGTTVSAERFFNLKQKPIVTNTVLSQTICSGKPTDLVTLTSDMVGATFSWTATASTGVSGFQASGTSSTLPIQTITNVSSSIGTVTYKVTPIFAGCAGPVIDYTVFVEPAPSIVIQPQGSSVCLGGSPTLLEMTFANMSGTPTYQWYSNVLNNTTSGIEIVGATGSTFSPPATGVGTFYYYCIVTLSTGLCNNITSKTATVIVNDLPTITTEPLSSQTVCVGGSIPSLNVSYVNGLGTPTYQWFSNTTKSYIGGNAITGATNSTYTPPVFNTVDTVFYFVQLTFPTGSCGMLTSEIAEVIVIEDPKVDVEPMASQTLCQGSTPLDLSVTMSGGLGSFAYQWYSNNSNSNVGGSIVTGATNASFTPPTNIIGTKYYYCEITQSSGVGCNALSAVAAVIVNASPIVSQQPVSQTICEGQAIVPLTVGYLNGVGIPSYQWCENTANNNFTGTEIVGATSSTYLPTNTAIGTNYYYCKINFTGGGCSNIVSAPAFVTINQVPVIASTTSTICSGDAFVISPQNSGVDIVPSGTTYKWDMPVFTPLGSVTGATAMVTPQTSISQALVNLTANPATVTYTVTPTSGSCSGASFSVIVTVNPAINLTTVVDNISCFGLIDGKITANISGGVPFASGDPYQISWTGPNGYVSNLATITGLSEGTYNLTILDSGGCPIKKNYTITEPADVTILPGNKKDINCFGAANGAIDISVIGGTLPYTYSWTRNGVAYASSEDISNLTPGTYDISVSDAKGCGTKTAQYVINEPPAMSILLTNKVDIKCYNNATGLIEVSVSGGTKKEIALGVFDYKYAWTGPNGFVSSQKDLSNLKAGVYNLIVTDSLGCQMPLMVQLTQPTDIIIDDITTGLKCYGDNNASISLTVTGGTAPYQVDWNNLATGLVQNNLSAGDYLITVTDANNCVKTKSIKIVSPPIYTVNPVIKHVSCFGAKDGSINLNYVGGVPPIKLTWNDGAVTGTTRNNIGPGTYSVAISDGTPCFINKTFTIIEPQPLTLTANVTHALDCVNANSGAVNLMVAGGTPPYNYNWSNGFATEDLNNVPSGNYLVTVTDSNGCIQTAQYIITRPAAIVPTVSMYIDYNCATQKLVNISTAKVTGGISPYTLSWSSGQISGINNEIMQTDQSGLVILTVTDKLGCKVDYPFTIEIPKVGINYQLVDCNLRKYQFNAIVPVEKDSYTYAWEFGDGGSSALKNPAHNFDNVGNYTVKLTMKTATCTSVFTDIITVEGKPTLKLDKIPSICKGDSVVMRVSGAQKYSWSNGSVADSVLIKKDGEYTVIGSTLAGCRDTLHFKVNYYDLFNYRIQTDKVEITTDGVPMHIWTDPIAFSQYYWDFGDGNTATGVDQSHVYDSSKAGHFDINLKVVNPNGCLEYASKRVWVINNSDINTFSPNNDGKNDTFMEGWHIQIYNRNGIFMYEGKNGWDGTYKGKTVKNDTYFYVLYYESEAGTKTKTGYITVMW